jgi:hypothetical protein
MPLACTLTALALLGPTVLNTVQHDKFNISETSDSVQNYVMADDSQIIL